MRDIHLGGRYQRWTSENREIESQVQIYAIYFKTRITSRTRGHRSFSMVVNRRPSDCSTW